MNRLDPARIAERFRVPGRLVTVGPTGSGNVNDTFLAVFRTAFSEQRVILQRINDRVFKRPRWIMHNMRVVTTHVIRRLEREAPREDRVWQLPRIIAAKDGKDFTVDPRGRVWRALTLIASATAHDRPQSPEHALEAGGVLGQFHRLVADLDPRRLKDTLPGFHVTPLYLKAYDAARNKAKAPERLGGSLEAKRVEKFIETRRGFVPVLENAMRRGELRYRNIHGDPKVSNVMIDDLTGKGTSIIDLDTVKPGLIHYDFGDALRSIANPAGEEERDLARVCFDEGLCEAFAKGYFPRARDFLTAADRRYLYDSIRLLAFELGLRFFTDYLKGDVYFKVADPEHNLRRARVQFKLCESIEAREGSLRRLLDSLSR